MGQRFNRPERTVMTSIIELHAVLKQAESDPRSYFGGEIDDILRAILGKCHPDRFSDDSEKSAAEEMFKKFSQLADQCRTPIPTIKSKTRTYSLDSLLAIGDVSDVHLASSGAEQFIVKASRVVGADKPLAQEHFILNELHEKSGDATYKFYFPTPIETIKASDGIRKQVNVFAFEPGGFTTEMVLAKHPDGLRGEHLAWIYKRLLTAIGFAHLHKYIHHAVLPCHLMIFPGTHGIQLLDWKQGGPSTTLKSIVSKYRDWYPSEVLKKGKTSTATDIYMATKCMIYLAGGDPVAEVIPSSVPRRMADFFRSALLERASMRPQNAWDFMDEFTEMLHEVYGTPKFHVLSMS